MSFNRSTVNPAVIKGSASLMSRANQMADPNNVFSLQTRDGGVAGKFPIQLGSADPDDVKMAIRQEAISGPNGTVPGMGQATAGPEVFNYLERKKEEVFYADFLAYINAQANFANPAEAGWWKQHFPMLYEKRLEQINREADKQKRLAQIQVTGPQNEDDFFLLYMIDQGLIEMPTRPVTELYLDKNVTKNKDNFIAGLFSPLTTKPQYGGMPRDVTAPQKWNNPFKLDANGNRPSGAYEATGRLGVSTGLGPGIFGKKVSQLFPASA